LTEEKEYYIKKCRGVFQACTRFVSPMRKRGKGRIEKSLGKGASREGRKKTGPVLLRREKNKVGIGSVVLVPMEKGVFHSPPLERGGAYLNQTGSLWLGQEGGKGLAGRRYLMERCDPVKHTKKGKKGARRDCPARRNFFARGSLGDRRKVKGPPGEKQLGAKRLSKKKGGERDLHELKKFKNGSAIEGHRKRGRGLVH